MLNLQNKSPYLKRPFQTWTIIWLALSGLLILNQIIIWALKHQHLSAGVIALDLIHHILSCAIFAWLIILPHGAWRIALSAFLTMWVAGLVFILVLEKNLALSSLTDTIVTQATFFLNYVIVVASVVVWLRRKARQASV